MAFHGHFVGIFIALHLSARKRFTRSLRRKPPDRRWNADYAKTSADTP
jgi:hypothetical protein